MRCFTWKYGKLEDGFALTSDERLGQVVFLGEEGRGRHYEKVSLGRHRPAEVVNGRVLEAHAAKVILPAKEGKPEKAFFVLERPRDEAGVLVRVNTHTSYIRNGQGCWRVVAGNPETLISGFGAFGDAGRIGNWKDGLVAMRPGDVLRVYPSRSLDGISSFALWVDEEGNPKTATWPEWENIQALAKVEAVLAETTAEGKGLDIVFGAMPCFTYKGRGEFESGIAVRSGATGPCVVLGQEGRGRVEAQMPIVGFTPGERLSKAAVAKLSEETVSPRYSWEKPVTKTIRGLTTADREETGTILVRVPVPMGNRSHREAKALRGSPVLLATGNVAGGIAGRVESAEDGLWVLKPGDILTIASYDYPLLRVISNVNGQLTSERGEEWEAQDGQANPAQYIAQGRAPWGHVPAEWVGRVVEVIGRYRGYDARTGRYDEVEYGCLCEGELVEIREDSVLLNFGWDGTDRREREAREGLWVKLTDKQVVKLEGELANAREQAKAEFGAVKAEAEAIRHEFGFNELENGLRARVSRAASGESDIIYATHRWINLSETSTEDLRSWVSRAKAVMDDARAALPGVLEAAKAKMAEEQARVEKLEAYSKVVRQAVEQTLGRALTDEGREFLGRWVSERGPVPSDELGESILREDWGTFDGRAVERMRAIDTCQYSNASGREWEVRVIGRSPLAEGVLDVVSYRYGGRDWIAARYRTDVVVAVSATIASGVSVKFTDQGKRWVRCDCGRTEKVDKAVYQRLTEDAPVELTCGGCGGRGPIVK